jgi:hypothetical protein
MTQVSKSVTESVVSLYGIADCGGIVIRHHYGSLARSAGKDFCDGAVVPFE